MTHLDLPVIWMILIGVAILTYIILDGFDLGVGILFALFGERHHRDLMMSSVAPFWDGNETWLILGGGGLFVAFPKAYATILPAMYLPVVAMLIALVFRGVAFEFRFKSEKSQPLWDMAFIGGSWVVAMMQGMILGTFLQGVEIVDGVYTGGAFGWINSFSLVVGLCVTIGYALIGVCWLIMKTEGDLQDKCYAIAPKLVILMIAAMGIISFVTPMINQNIAMRWFTWPENLYLLPIPFHTAVFTLVLIVSLKLRREILPFISTIALFTLSFLGLVISIWPYMVPYELTFYEAAAAPNSQLFTLTGVLLMLPVVIAYTCYNYWVFRGKVTEVHHY